MERIEAPARFTLDPARAAPFDPQVARRMTQLESELTRLAESQHSAREERLKLSEEVAHLRSAARANGSPASAQIQSRIPAEPEIEPAGKL